MDISFKEWLYRKYDDSDIMPLPWDLSVSYMPIDSTRKKLDIMRTEFNAVVNCIDITINAINTFEKDTCFFGTVKYSVQHPDFGPEPRIFCGSASFLRAQYPKGWAFAQICESLATTRAFAKEFPQFGQGLNKEDLLPDMKAPVTPGSDRMNKTLKTIGNPK